MHDRTLLLQHVADARREEFAAYIDDLVRNDDCFGIDGDFLGFMADYVNIAALTERKGRVWKMPRPDEAWGTRIRPPASKTVTVYDVGCSTALQHILFDEGITYVGIDMGHRRPEPKFFRSDCTFVRGRFAEVVESLNVNPAMAIGVANMSLLYGSNESDLELFDRTFRHKIIL